MLKPTDSPFWQAARPSPRPMCVLPGDDVLPAGHILRAGELQHEGLVERGNGREVEAVQTLQAGNRASLIRRSTMRRSRSISSSSARRSR